MFCSVREMKRERRGDGGRKGEGEGEKEGQGYAEDNSPLQDSKDVTGNNHNSIKHSLVSNTH